MFGPDLTSVEVRVEQEEKLQQEVKAVHRLAGSLWSAEEEEEEMSSADTQQQPGRTGGTHYSSTGVTEYSSTPVLEYSSTSVLQSCVQEELRELLLIGSVLFLRFHF